MAESNLVKGDKKIINSWALYDWANSVYNLVITATIFPIYYKAVTEPEVQVFGTTIKNTTLYDFSISFGYFIIVLIAPILSGIADYGGYKKRFMQFFCYMGALSCALLYFFDSDSLWWGITFSTLACIGFSGSLVFYNAFLPEIAHPEDQDRVSAKGFSMGYIGSSILLIINLVTITFHDSLGMDKQTATKIAFLTVGAWWFLFAQIPFYYLPNNVYGQKPEGNPLSKGYQEIKKVLRELSKTKRLKRFLLAFFIYSMGVQTIMLIATHFGMNEIKMDTNQLILTILIIQFVAIAGAYLFSFTSGKLGNIFTLRAATMFWSLICIGTYFLVFTPAHFYIVAVCVGLVMGGTQSLSRSTYSKFLPDTQDHASFFSFYDICEKLSIVFGLALFGIINELSTSMREPIIILISFFVLGYLLLLRIENKR